jgi:ABC-type antimicrobial peptide transport system permease subunit
MPVPSCCPRQTGNRQDSGASSGELEEVATVHTKGDIPYFGLRHTNVFCRVRGAKKAGCYASVRVMKKARLRTRASCRALQPALIGSFAAFAVLVASVGIYGLMSCSVRQCTQEFGICLAQTRCRFLRSCCVGRGRVSDSGWSLRWSGVSLR